MKEIFTLKSSIFNLGRSAGCGWAGFCRPYGWKVDGDCHGLRPRNDRKIGPCDDSIQFCILHFALCIHNVLGVFLLAYEREVGMLREFGRVSRGLREVLRELSEEERRILEKMYIVPKNGNLDELCQELGVEKSSVYRRRDKALARFSVLWRGWEAGR